MLSLSSPLSDMSADEEYAAPRAESSGDGRGVSNSQMDGDGISDRLAFTFDFSNLDEDGRPKNKLARKLSRNESEKMRRDRLNAYIAELARLVPLIFSSSRKLDKASILRLTVTYLKIYHNLIKNGCSWTKWKPDFLTFENLGNLLVESVNGFLLVVNQSGQLIFTTDAFTSILGHSLVDILGVSIYKIIHPEDEDIMMEQLKGFQEGSTEGSGNKSFYVRMIAKTNKPTIHYENIHIVGHLKIIPASLSTNITHKESEFCLIGVGRVVTSEIGYELCPIPDENTNQWITRHEMDGTITFSDQRGALLTGFLPGESVGLPAYSLVHPEDISSIVAVHNMILTTGSVPVTVFRMFTKSRDVLYIRNNTHIVVDMWTSKPKYIISINEVISEELGHCLLAEQHEKLNALPSNYDSGAPSSVDSASSDVKSEETTTAPNNLVIPEIMSEPSGNVSVIVGKQKYEIALGASELNLCNKPNTADNAESCHPIFDPDVHKDEGHNGIPMIRPVFLGEESNRSRTGKSMFDEINTYLGNEPAVIRTVMHSTRPQRYQSADSSAADEALSNLHVAISSASYPARSPEQELTSGQALSMTSNPEGCPKSLGPALHQINGGTGPCSTQQSGETNHLPFALENSTRHNTFVPSTNTRHNRTLLQLLNTKTSQDKQIREAMTSHFVTDSFTLNAGVHDLGCDGDRNSSDLPTANRFKDAITDSRQRLSQQNLKDFRFQHLQNSLKHPQQENLLQKQFAQANSAKDVFQTFQELVDLEVKCGAHIYESNDQTGGSRAMTQPSVVINNLNQIDYTQHISEDINERQQPFIHGKVRNKLPNSCNSEATPSSCTFPNKYKDMCPGSKNKFGFDEMCLRQSTDSELLIPQQYVHPDNMGLSQSDSAADNGQCERLASVVWVNTNKVDSEYNKSADRQSGDELPVSSPKDLILDDREFNYLFDDQELQSLQILLNDDLNSFDSSSTPSEITSRPSSGAHWQQW